MAFQITKVYFTGGFLPSLQFVFNKFRVILKSNFFLKYQQRCEIPQYNNFKQMGSCVCFGDKKGNQGSLSDPGRKSEKPSINESKVKSAGDEVTVDVNAFKDEASRGSRPNIIQIGNPVDEGKKLQFNKEENIIKKQVVAPEIFRNPEIQQKRQIIKPQKPELLDSNNPLLKSEAKNQITPNPNEQIPKQQQSNKKKENAFQDMQDTNNLMDSLSKNPKPPKNNQRYPSFMQENENNEVKQVNSSKREGSSSEEDKSLPNDGLVHLSNPDFKTNGNYVTVGPGGPMTIHSAQFQGGKESINGDKHLEQESAQTEVVQGSEANKKSRQMNPPVNNPDLLRSSQPIPSEYHIPEGKYRSIAPQGSNGSKILQNQSQNRKDPMKETVYMEISGIRTVAVEYRDTVEHFNLSLDGRSYDENGRIMISGIRSLVQQRPISRIEGQRIFLDSAIKSN